MRLYNILTMMAACMTLPLGIAQAKQAAVRPNIIFIITDDQPIEELGYIKDKALTPNIDRMAREGIRFDSAYVASSVCSPSRYTCLSGQYASRSGTTFFTDQNTEEGVTRVLWNVGFSHDQITLPRALQAAGYATGFVGKWHINGLGVPKESVAPGSDASKDPGVNAIVRENQEVMRKAIQFWGFDYANAVLRGNLHDDPYLTNSGLDYHNMEWMTKAGLDFIEAHKDEPFYLYFSTTLTHVPDPLESLECDPRKSPGGYMDEPITGVQPSRESVIKRCKAKGISPERWSATWLDDGVGALMKKLEDLGIAENTLIFYFVDHGMEARSKGTCYEGGLITPTLAYWPGKTKAKVCKELIQNIDFAPTILDVAGITPPEEMIIDGKSFAPLLHNMPFKGHDSVYSEIGLTRAISTRDWKYVAFRVPPSLERTLEERLAEQEEVLASLNDHDRSQLEAHPDAPYYQMGMNAGGSSFERYQYELGGDWKPNYFDRDQIYNLRKDPAEARNLASNRRYRYKLKEMQEIMREYLEDLPGTFMDLKPTE